MEWADGQAGDPADFNIEEKALNGASAYEANLMGERIQRYVTADAASGSIEISLAGLQSIPSGVAPTIELQIPVISPVSTVTIPSAAQIVSMPAVLEGGKERARLCEVHVP